MIGEKSKFLFYFCAQNENRLKMTVFSVKPVDFRESSKRLLQDIERLAGVSVKKS